MLHAGFGGKRHKLTKSKHMENIKNSKGEVLSQPYLDLARMRKEKRKQADTGLLAWDFIWRPTLEGNDWWDIVDKGETPEIPAASLAELEDWRKYKPAIPKNETAEPDWKAMYEDMKAERDYYRHEYELKSMELDDIDSRPTPDRNWVAECAMAAMQGFLASYAGATTDPKVEPVAQKSWDYAEAMSAEGRKRGHLPKNENA